MKANNIKQSFFRWVASKRVLLAVVFVLIACICLGLKQLVSINYDMNNYLPENAPSSMALDVMSEEFTGGIPGAMVMVKDVDVEQALEYKKQIANVAPYFNLQSPLILACF